jgi:hypothetical protein
MSDMENQAEFYYEKLNSKIPPGQVLLDYYRETTGKVDGLGIIMVNKLVKMYGRFTTFFAIQELAKYDNLQGNVFPLLLTICKNRFERINNTIFSISHESLDKHLKELDKEREIARRSKGKVPSSEGLE